MSLTVLQTPGTINPYAEALQTTLGGINQLVEQDAINRALARVNQGEIDPLTAIFGTQMPAARQQQLLSGFQEQEKIGAARQQAQQKAQAEQQKLLSAEEKEQAFKNTFQKFSPILNNPDVSADELEALILSDPEADPDAQKQLLQVARSRRSDVPKFEARGDQLAAEASAEFGKQITKRGKNVALENQRLERQRALNEKGTLTGPAAVKLIDTLGLPIGILQNPDTEEFRKLEQDFVRDVNDVFRGQIRVFEIQAFLKTVPQLINSKEGREVIIRNRLLLNEADKLRFDAYKDILKENNGRIPRNAELLVEERVGDQIANLAQQFSTGINDAIEPTQVSIPMIDGQGRAYNIPANKVQQARAQGLQLQ